MVLGNLMNQSGQQYVAIKDDKNTWRVLDTWHADLKMLSADDDICCPCPGPYCFTYFITGHVVGHSG